MRPLVEPALRIGRAHAEVRGGDPVAGSTTQALSVTFGRGFTACLVPNVTLTGDWVGSDEFRRYLEAFFNAAEYAAIPANTTTVMTSHVAT